MNYNYYTAIWFYLDRNPFDDVPCDLLLTTIVKSRSARVRMTRQTLYVFKGHSLFQEVGYSCHPE
jgi:hypothetical protein